MYKPEIYEWLSILSRIAICKEKLKHINNRGIRK